MPYEASYLLINRIFLLIIGAVSIWLAFWVYLANRKEKSNKLFFITTLSLLFWWIGGYFFAFSNNLRFSLVLGRIILGEVSISFTFIYFFIIVFPYEIKRNKIFERIIAFLAVIFFVLSIYTDLVVKDVRLTEWGIDPVYGKLQIFYYGWIAFLMFLIFVKLFQKYKKVPKETRLKIQYFSIGFIIFVLMNLIFNVFFPMWRDSIKYWQFGNYSAIIFLGFTAYAMVKTELFGIKVVLTEMLVGIISVLLLAQVLGSETIFEYIWKGALFIIFLPFGYMLIQSVTREIHLREALQKAYAKLQVLDKAKSEFISIASHQLRTPLTAIKGYISMILEGSYGSLPEKAQRPVENVYKSAERLIILVNDLLSVSRLEAGKIKIEPKKISIEKLISGIIEELKIKADEKKIYLKFQKPFRALPRVVIDPDKIRQVILNIIDNAIRYTTVGGITVETEIEGRNFRVIISDTGEGMTREEISHVFESFARGKAGGRLWTEGTGLGLYVARRFVEMHHGKVWVESEGKGKGSTFFIELPRRPGNQNFNKFMKSV